MKYYILFIFSFSLIQVRAQSLTLRHQVDHYVTSYVTTGDFAGCILITQNDSTLYQKCFGKADLIAEMDNKPGTKFNIGSISKQFTAAGILLLEEKGKLSTNDTISKYYPQLPNAGGITIQQLLTHTSGVVDIFNLPNFSQYSHQNHSLNQMAGKLLERELLFEPGSNYQYSNGGYALLADIIEQVSGKSYGPFMQEWIFRPLGMYHSHHSCHHMGQLACAQGYDPSGYKDLTKAAFIDFDLLKGSGSLYSTVGDLSKWVGSLVRRDFLSEQSYEKFFKNYGNNYGYGISLYKSFGKKVFGHDGRISGFIGDYLHYQEDNMTIIILGNIQTGVADFFRRDLAAILLEQEYRSRAKTEPPAENYPVYTDLALGSYSFGPNFTVYVEKIKGIVKARANEGSYSELIPLKNGKWFSRTLYSYIEFASDEQGEIVKMIWTNNDGNQFEGTKE